MWVVARALPYKFQLTNYKEVVTNIILAIVGTFLSIYAMVYDLLPSAASFNFSWIPTITFLIVIILNILCILVIQIMQAIKKHKEEKIKKNKVAPLPEEIVEEQHFIEA